MSDKLTPNTKHLLRLIQQGEAAGNGWASVSVIVLPFVKEMPKELVTVIANPDGTGKAQLTPIGETVLRWI